MQFLLKLFTCSKSRTVKKSSKYKNQNETFKIGKFRLNLCVSKKHLLIAAVNEKGFESSTTI